MVDVYIRDVKGHPFSVRFCRRCVSLNPIYIAGRIKLNPVDVPKLLGLAFGLTIAVLNIVFGRMITGQLGLFIALAGLLTGAGISVAFAVSIAMPQGGGEVTQ
jgi:hypothetical protein